MSEFKDQRLIRVKLAVRSLCFLQHGQLAEQRCGVGAFGQGESQLKVAVFKSGEAGLFGAQAHDAALLAQTGGFEAGGEPGVLSGDGSFEFAHFADALQLTHAPERRGEFAHALLEALSFIAAKLRQPDPALHALLVREIGATGGVLPFSRFMELALYAPGLGYYVERSKDAAHGLSLRMSVETQYGAPLA